jgi:hypothetical protein
MMSVSSRDGLAEPMPQHNETTVREGSTGEDALFMPCGYTSPCGYGTWCAGRHPATEHNITRLISHKQTVALSHRLPLWAEHLFAVNLCGAAVCFVIMQ